MSDTRGTGSRIREAREQAGLSQRELAARLRRSKSFVAHIELGTRDPKASTLEEIAAATGVPIETLVRRPATGEEDPGRPGEAAVLTDLLAAADVPDKWALVALRLAEYIVAREQTEAARIRAEETRIRAEETRIRLAEETAQLRIREVEAPAVRADAHVKAGLRRLIDEQISRGARSGGEVGARAAR